MGNSNKDYDMNDTFQDFMDFHGDLRCENCEIETQGWSSTIIAGIEVQCTQCLSNTTDLGDEDDCSIEIETQGLGV